MDEDQESLVVRNVTEVQDAEPVRIDPVNAEALIAKAIEKDVPIEALERLLAMRKELKAEAAEEAFYISLAGFQRWCPIIVKTENVYEKNGDDVRYRFAPLDVIVKKVHKKLETFGFSYTIKTEQTPESVKAICIAHHRDGHSESTDFLIPIDPKAYMSNAQKVASALTYAKRYAFCNA